MASKTKVLFWLKRRARELTDAAPDQVAMARAGMVYAERARAGEAAAKRVQDSKAELEALAAAIECVEKHYPADRSGSDGARAGAEHPDSIERRQTDRGDGEPDPLSGVIRHCKYACGCVTDETGLVEAAWSPTETEMLAVKGGPSVKRPAETCPEHPASKLERRWYERDGKEVGIYP